MKNHNYKNNYYRLIAEICDFFFLNILIIQKFVEENVKIIKKAIKTLPINYIDIYERVQDIHKNIDAQTLKNVFEKFANGEIEKDDIELLSHIQFMQQRYTKGNKETIIVEKIGLEAYNTVHEILRENNIFIWSKGELEDYFTEKTKMMSGTKDTKALDLSHILQNENEKFKDFFMHTDEIEMLVNLILKMPQSYPVLI